MQRSHEHVDGSLALTFDFEAGGPVAPRRFAKARVVQTGGSGALTLARRIGGPDKYQQLEHRRRQAQIRARHLLDVQEEN